MKLKHYCQPGETCVRVTYNTVSAETHDRVHVSYNLGAGYFNSRTSLTVVEWLLTVDLRIWEIGVIPRYIGGFPRYIGGFTRFGCFLIPRFNRGNPPI